MPAATNAAPPLRAGPLAGAAGVAATSDAGVPIGGGHYNAAPRKSAGAAPGRAAGSPTRSPERRALHGSAHGSVVLRVAVADLLLLIHHRTDGYRHALRRRLPGDGDLLGRSRLKSSLRHRRPDEDGAPGQVCVEVHRDAWLRHDRSAVVDGRRDRPLTLQTVGE